MQACPDVEEIDVVWAGIVEQGGQHTQSWDELHKQACEQGKDFYSDPETQLMVMTSLCHMRRGKCCGSGCRHCPYAHERVPEERRARSISQPAWLFTPNGASTSRGRSAVVLFWSTGKDSYLCLRALQRTRQADSVVLLTTFDHTSRIIANQETTIDDALRQAKALDLPLLGVPLQRSGEQYVSVIQRAIGVVHATYSQGVAALAFGDLHLEHIRQWREQHLTAADPYSYELIFPLWRVPYDTLLDDLENSGVPCAISAVANEMAAAVVQVGEPFSRALAAKLGGAGVDAFGERGEFHTLAKVWEAAEPTCN